MGLGLAGTGAVVIGLGPPIGNNDRNYKYQVHCNVETTQTDHEPAASSSPTSVSLSPCTSSSLNPNPLLLHLYP